MSAPLSRVVSRTEKIAQTCTLACGHLHEHGPNDVDCAVTAHRCELCARGISPQVEAMEQEGGKIVDFGRLHTESITGATERGRRLTRRRNEERLTDEVVERMIQLSVEEDDADDLQ